MRRCVSCACDVAVAVSPAQRERQARLNPQETMLWQARLPCRGTCIAARVLAPRQGLHGVARLPVVSDQAAKTLDALAEALAGALRLARGRARAQLVGAALRVGRRRAQAGLPAADVVVGRLQRLAVPAVPVTGKLGLSAA